MTERVALFVATNHPAFAGHFPGSPIVPGALLIDLAVRAVEQASGRHVAAIAQAKFLSPATPGEALALLYETNGNAVRFEIEAIGDNTQAAGDSAHRKLATGRFTLGEQPA
ncbi:MAG: hypothetical protein JWM03_824 [Rhodocyclales bacterium]|nr:hypothetical protein [Rhodocyclales bacterium]